MRNRTTFALATLLLFSASSAIKLCAQTKSDAQIAGVGDDIRPAVLIEASWSRLTNALTGTKNTDTRIAAITGLSLLGGNARAEKLIRDAMSDPDVDVRLAAIVAAGEMAKNGSRNLTTDLRNQLNSDDPKVAFTSASTLWKADDPSGEDILMAVAQGERSGDYSFWKGSEHNANRTLHSPSALAKIAAQQSMVILVPPIGMGMGAYGYLKGAGGPSPQVTSITQIAKEHIDPVKHALVEATKTKDQGARLAAAEALAKFRGDDVREALRNLFTDSKENVRLTASAAYIRVSTGPATTAARTKSKTAKN
jgi:HEAT repeat protein